MWKKNFANGSVVDFIQIINSSDFQCMWNIDKIR